VLVSVSLTGGLDRGFVVVAGGCGLTDLQVRLMLQHAWQHDGHITTDNLSSPGEVVGLCSVHAAEVIGRQIGFVRESYPERIGLRCTDRYLTVGICLLERDRILCGHVPNGIGKALCQTVGRGCVETDQLTDLADPVIRSVDSGLMPLIFNAVGIQFTCLRDGVDLSLIGRRHGVSESRIVCGLCRLEFLT